MSRRLGRGRTTAIRVDGETWHVPFYFGVAYKATVGHHERLKPEAAIQSLSDALGLIGYDVSAEVIAKWELRKRIEAHVFAWYEHLSAGDNPVPRHPKLDWLPLPWGGPDTDMGHGPTVVLE